MTTGEKLLAARNASGMSRPQLAAATGISVRTIEKYEQGVTFSPRLADMAAIAAALGMRVDDFVADPEPPPPKRTKRKPG